MGYGHYVLIDCTCLLMMSIMLTLTSFIKMRKTINSFLLGFAILVIIDVITIKVIETIWISNPLLFGQLISVIIVHSLIAFYLSLNSYLVIVRRGEKFYDHESIYCFYCYWTDIISYFWIDMFVIMKKKTRSKKKN